MFQIGNNFKIIWILNVQSLINLLVFLVYSSSINDKLFFHFAILILYIWIVAFVIYCLIFLWSSVILSVVKICIRLFSCKCKISIYFSFSFLPYESDCIFILIFSTDKTFERLTPVQGYIGLQYLWDFSGTLWYCSFEMSSSRQWLPKL